MLQALASQLYSDFFQTDSPYELNVSALDLDSVRNAFEQPVGMLYWDRVRLVCSQETELETAKSHRDTVSLIRGATGSGSTASSSVFAKALRSVMYTLRSDCFPRFLDSDMYQKHVRALQLENIRFAAITDGL